MGEQFVTGNILNNILSLNMHMASRAATFLFLPSLSLQSDIPLPGLGEGVERMEREGEGVKSLIGGAGEGVGVGELVGEGHPRKAMGV